MKVIAPKAPKTAYWRSTPIPAAVVTAQPSAHSGGMGRRPRPGAGHPVAEQERLDGADRDPGDGAHQGQLADAGAVADRPGTGEQADAHGPRPCSEPSARGSE